MRLAALTMSYNEPVWARVWARHYARQVGAENCFLLDHGSDDGSTEGLPIHVERFERTALDEDERAARIGAKAAALLERYDAVVHADVDELVLADPRRFGDLRTFAAGCGAEALTTVGLDVQHLQGEEDGLEPERPLGEQRRWVRFSGAMCKPALIRRPVRWTPGFHACDAPMRTGGLFLLHLRYADTALGLKRLGRTRGQAFAHPELNAHQRVPDEAFATMLHHIAQLPKQDIPFDSESGEMGAWMGRVRAAQAGGGDWLSIAGDALWELPRRFRAAI